MNQKPSIGRIVHVKHLDGTKFHNQQDVAAATITAVWDDHCVNLRVTQDGPPQMDLWRTSVIHEEGVAPGFTGLVWFWPPRV